MGNIPTGPEYMVSRREHVAEMFRAVDSAGTDYDTDEAYDELDSMPLSIESEQHVIIVLGTGGPHDEIDYNVTRDSATYIYGWGTEQFRFQLSNSDPLVRLARYYADVFEGE